MTYLCPCTCHRVDPSDDVWCNHCAEQHPAPTLREEQP